MKNHRKCIHMIAAGIISVSAILASFDCLAASDPRMTLSKVSFDQLIDWETDDHTQALRAFQLSCTEIFKRDPQSSTGPLVKQVTTSQWQVVCRAANKIHRPDSVSSRRFFERWFEPYHLANANNHEGLFTGYYLPLIQARLKPNKRFHVPIYALPKDLVKVDLGLFRSEYAGKSIVGQVNDNALSPYPDRIAIENREINNNTDVLAWSDNAIDVYFAQIQGSSVVQLADKKRFVIGYAGDNGHKYTAIGKVLISRGQLTRENVSMQTIREWLLQHPKQASEVLNQNNSYVFFKVLKDNNPLGTEKVSLTPERSLAVDNRYIPFGAPIWLNTSIPEYPSEQTTPFRHLLIAQDTGGAIKGVVRGDIYWGTGNKAEFIAGRMNNPGECWILLPR